MKTSDFNFNLPGHLVAQYPPETRGKSRLMTLDRVTGKKAHRAVDELPEILNSEFFLNPADGKPLLVFNDTRVRKSRLTGISVKSGAKAEFLLLELKNEAWKALVRRSCRRKTGSRFIFQGADGSQIAEAEIKGSDSDFCFLEFDRLIDEEFLEKNGSVPLPPYIKRKDTSFDEMRYQTVYAKRTGSAAAPTAGLHFTNELLRRISDSGIDSVFITLHVGLGTFQPVRSENIEDHKIHSESFFIDENAACKIEEAKTQNRKIIAVGTTSVRTLESAWTDGKLKRGHGSTSIFIFPGFNFKVVDALFTNFHTPESTLLMLVCALAGKDLILESYAEAVRNDYRFFSYGDAMLIY